MNKTIWQQEKLPPLEFCNIKRASEILKCTVDDLMHLGAIGAIELCIMFDNIPSSLLVRGFSTEWEGDKKKILSAFNSIEGKTKDYLFFDKTDFFSKFKIEKENITTFSFNAGRSEMAVLLLGMAHGLWALTYQDVNILKVKQEHVIKTLYPERHLSFQDNNELYCVLYGKDLFHSEWNNRVAYGFESVNVNVNDLLISRRTIDKIYETMIKGSQLPSFVNGGLSGSYLNNAHARGEIKLTGLFEDVFQENINLEDSLLVTGLMLNAMKKADTPSKRWTQDALKNEILDKDKRMSARLLDSYFSLANKSFKSDS